MFIQVFQNSTYERYNIFLHLKYIFFLHLRNSVGQNNYWNEIVPCLTFRHSYKETFQIAIYIHDHAFTMYHFVFSFVSVTNCQNGTIKMWIYLWRNNRRIRSSWTRQHLFVWFIPAGLVCSKSQYKLSSPCSWCRRGEILK